MNTLDTNTTRAVRVAGIAAVSALAVCFAAIAWMGDYITQASEALGIG